MACCRDFTHSLCDTPISDIYMTSKLIKHSKMKSNNLRLSAAAAVMAAALPVSGALVAHFDMEVAGGNIRETITGTTFPVEGHFTPENVDGAIGKALRFDGYTSHVDARLGDILPEGTQTMTVSAWVAVPCYPIIQLDTNTKEQTVIAGCLDETAKRGFGFYLGFNGNYSFRMYAGGWPVTVESDIPLTPNVWHNLTATVDCAAGQVKIYDNGIERGSGRVSGSLSSCAGLSFYMGQGTASRMQGPFELMSYNGLIDDISIWDEVKTPGSTPEWSTDATPDLDIPASRFANDMLRPRFHGMPAAGWTNECHGMYHSDGRFHLFFQKNGDGPYMARLHWGHITSENLFDWREEKIALAPGDWYDIKGCWSGCVFHDEELTGGKPNIIYTAVDYAKAMIARAVPETAALDNWIKYSGNPIISGRPDGLSDDFRDPYFFRDGNNAYLIVGTSKNGIGATTLHRYNAADGTWSNNGEIFFNGTSADTDGVFWEMPNITRMPDGKWLFTATPLGTSQGVRTLYWTGTIGADGKFIKDSYSVRPRFVELNSREGFGLLSPTIYPYEGKTLVLGIVPDKLRSSVNWDLGWAHCYSLPREWSLDSNGSLVQKPYEGLTAMRTATKVELSDFDLSGIRQLSPVEGRSAELLAVFEAGTAPVGFNIFKNGSSQGVVKYDPVTGILTADFSGMPRLVNDAGVYDGVYTCALPQRPEAGSEVKINIFIDHSILDIFVNDRWATSIRVFPTESGTDSIEAFAEGTVRMRSLCAWKLDPASGGSATAMITDPEAIDVTDVSGTVLRHGVKRSDATDGLCAGIYIVGGKKTLVK